MWEMRIIGIIKQWVGRGMKKVVKLIEEHCRKNNVDAIRGLDVTTDYLIDCFDIRHYYKQGGWEEFVLRKKEESEELFQVLIIWLKKVAEAIDNGGWLDFFGGVYEEMYQSKSKASAMGQFFTPPSVSDLLAWSVAGANDDRVNDCACGSGRLLLAQWAKSENKKAYYQGEDLDFQSVKMCALNLMAHGCRGRVVQHDTLLNPILFDYGFELNEIRYPIPTPYYSLRKIHHTKEDVRANNERLKKKFGDNVIVKKLMGNGELIDVYYPPIKKEPHKPSPEFKQTEKKETPESVANKSIKPVQLSLFE